MRKNWQKVMRLPDFGCSDVTRSRVSALLGAQSQYTAINDEIENIDEPATSTKYKTQGSGINHLCKSARDSYQKADAGQAKRVKESHD